MSSVTKEKSGKRADAQRNSDAILSTAIGLFRERGVEIPLDVVAKEAGVGSGTLYRHYPTREALLAAALQHKDAELIAVAERVRGMDDIPAAINEWISALQDYLRTFNGLPNPIIWAMNGEASPLSVTCDQMLDITKELLDEGATKGLVRPDVTAKALFQCILGTSWALNFVGEGDSGAAMLRDLLRRGYLSN